MFYVSVSRGRESVTIYTDKKNDLIKSINKDGDRMAVSEMKRLDSSKEALEMNRLNEYQKDFEAEKEIDLNLNRDRYDEPEI